MVREAVRRMVQHGAVLKLPSRWPWFGRRSGGWCSTARSLSLNARPPALSFAYSGSCRCRTTPTCTPPSANQRRSGRAMRLAGICSVGRKVGLVFSRPRVARYIDLAKEEEALPSRLQALVHQRSELVRASCQPQPAATHVHVHLHSLILHNGSAAQTFMSLPSPISCAATRIKGGGHGC